MFKPELLAPAGDLERLKIAFMYGADAVYLGGEYSLRANANNFSLEDIKKGVEYAHKLNKKVYITLNIAMHNKEVREIKDYLKQLNKIKVDAVIISDPGLIDMIKENTNLEIHLSTQGSTLNKEAIEFWQKQGISRVVLARECTKEDIKDIKENTNAELEVFIHGAMCASYSGRCVLSNFLTNRDSNRGGCSQICRWDFDLKENEKKVEGEKPFTLCAKDLSLLKYIPDLIDLKIDSLKIEGRMRSAYYIATIIKVYRQVIDEYTNNKEKYEYKLENENILRRCANRDSVPQFFNGDYDENTGYYNGRMEVTNQDFLGTVLSYDSKTNLAKVEQRNYFKVGDEITIFGPKEEYSFRVKELYDENMNKIEIVRHPKQVVYLKVTNKVKQNYMLKKTLTKD